MDNQFAGTQAHISTFSEAEFRSLYDAAPIGLSIADEQGSIVSVNQAIREKLGYTAEELEGLNISEIYADPGERNRLMVLLSQSNHVRDFETEIKHKDGTVCSVLMNSDRIELDHTILILTSIYDITRYAEVKQELKASEDRYHLLFSNAPIGITVTDSSGNLIASNQAIQELLGYSLEELKTINARDFYTDPNERLRLLHLTEVSGTVRDFETKFKRMNGYEITVLINTELIEFKGCHNLLLTSIRDISHLKRVEEELTKERDFTNAILDTTASLVLVLDREGRITRFNHACEMISGYTFEETVGHHMWDFLSANPTRSKEKFEELLAGNYPITHENFWQMKNGGQYLISWSSTVLKNNEGQVRYIVATGIDITEQRTAETALREAGRKMAVWVSELEARAIEMKLLSDMGEQLQSCQTIEEACDISAQFIRMICPDSKGAICLINSSKNLAEAVQMWGDPPYTEKTFLPMSCGAVRRSRPHLVDAVHPGLRCSHITGPQDCQYLCVPMMAQGETIGILHLNHAAPDQIHSESPHTQYSSQKMQVVMDAAEHISLALSNLHLREALRQQSIRDILTGLYNRRYMEETLSRELHRADREKKTVGVIMFDIDHFKAFNDLAGHDGGDALLRELGVFLRTRIRGSDIVCRYGGEEFVWVLPGTTLEVTRMRAEEIRQGVKQLLVYHLGQALGKCSISLGVAEYPKNGQSSEAILKSADKALYCAKKEGRDRVVVAV